VSNDGLFDCHFEERSDEQSVFPGVGRKQIPRVARNDKNDKKEAWAAV
jgi:hypothetical protein